MVYSFTWGTASQLEIQDSGIGGGGSGMSDFNGRNSDLGTITVNVLREQPDHGLVVVLSETAQKTRNASPALCVVYGTTIWVCDPNKTVHEEEATLLRFLGANFVDPALIDAKQHWEIKNSNGRGYSIDANYAIVKNDNGNMTIQENRVVKQAEDSGGGITGTATIHYDFAKQIPISISEYTTARRSQGATRYTTIKTQTVLNLVSDSMGAKP